LLKLPKDKRDELIALGDYWKKQVVTERGLRSLRRGIKEEAGSPKTTGSHTAIMV